MKIVLFGSNGQVGWELQRTLPLLGELVIANREALDLSSSNGLNLFLERERPNIIVNAAAYNAVDLAESEPEAAQRVNYLAVKEMAEFSARNGAWLIHYSTDYVFDGKLTRPYTEADAPNPISAYGESKRNGELAVIQSGCNHLIFRTSWVYSTRGKNFAKTILRLAAEKAELTVVSDQVGTPTSAEMVADITALCIRHILETASAHEISGTYHLVASGNTNWHAYARYILSEAQRIGIELACTKDGVTPISADSYPTKAARPKYSILDNKKIRETFNLSLPSWEFFVTRMLTELID